VIWDSPAFNAGLAPGMKVIAVGGREYSSQRLKDAVAAAAKDKAPIMLLVKQFDRIETMSIAYHGGLQYPVLERITGKPDRLADLWKAR
jgi:predicted metalloprotease with PDZ domain